jgi:hypothetical protein
MEIYRFGERFDIDTIGPLSKDDYENEYVVVIVVAFSRFVKLKPVKSTSGLDAARAHARASFVWIAERNS